MQKSKKMTKQQDLKNEVRRSWRLKNAKDVPVIAGPTRMMTKNLTDILNIGAIRLGASGTDLAPPVTIYH